METKAAGKGIKVTEVKIRLLDKTTAGLVGWASCVINDAIFLNNIAIRLNLENKIMLVYPAKKSQHSLKYFYFNPITQEASRALNEAVIEKLQRATGGQA